MTEENRGFQQGSRGDEEPATDKFHSSGLLTAAVTCWLIA